MFKIAKIRKSYLDDSGRHILVLSDTSVHIRDTFISICSLQKMTLADEYQISVKGKMMIFGPNVTFRELMELFYNLNSTVPLETNRLSEEDRNELEYYVISFDKTHWTPTENLQALYSQLDIALLFHQIEWAKDLYQSIQHIERILHTPALLS